MVRRFGIVLLLALAGALVYGTLLIEVTPLASLDLKQSRGEILDVARDHMRTLGFDVSGLQEDAWLSFAGSSQLFWQDSLGMTGANILLRKDSLATHAWEVTWYNRSLTRSQNPVTYSAWLSPSGKLLGFDHRIRDSVRGRSLKLEEAQAIAEEFLRGHGVDLSPYRLRNSSDAKHPSRTDYTFVYATADTSFERTIWVRVQGDAIGGFRETFEPAGLARERASSSQTTFTFLVTASYAATFLLFFFIVLLFLRKYHEGEVGTTTALMVFLGLFGVAVAQNVNGFPVIGARTFIGDMNQFNVRIVLFVITIAIIQMFLSVMAFAAWSVGESSARGAWPTKLTGVDSVLFRKVLTLDVAEGLLRGYCWGFIISGAYVGLLALALRAGLTGLMVPGISGLAEAYVPPVQAVLLALGGAVFTEIVFRLFFLSYLREKWKRTLPAVVVSVLLFTVTSLTVWDVPFGLMAVPHTAAALVLFGLAFSVLFLRYDLLTTMAANFIVLALHYGVPTWVASGEAAGVDRAVFFGLLCVPMLVAAGGFVLRRRFVFTPETLPSHIKRISERVRMAKELEIARAVQMSLLPKTNPAVRGFDIAGVCVPAQEVGGDYFDFITLGGGTIGIAIGDVSGKGVPAAIYMTLTKGILQSHAEELVSPRTVLRKVNSLMYRTIDRNSFVSMFYAVLNPVSRSIRFARAGQCPMILVQEEGGKGSFVSPRGMALGLEDGTVFDTVIEEQEMSLAGGEVLVFYTDGFTEAMNDRDEEFGESRLVESIGRHRRMPAARMIDAVCEDVRAFTGERPQHDDMTMVVVRVGETT